MTKLIIIRGYPGSGKTTIAKALAEAGIGKFIDHNAILTFIANLASNDDGIYEEIANLELGMTRKLLNENSTVLVARGFSNLESIKGYEDIASELGLEYTVIRLEVDKSTLCTRVQSKERLDDFNPTVTERALTRWIENNPLISHPLEKIIDNTRPKNEVVREIISIL
jgi:adenylate kinase family enzyme